MSIRITSKKNLPNWLINEQTKGTEFGKPTFVKYGKTIDIQEYIESNREDTEIYPTLEKYGTLKPLEKSFEAIFNDFTEYNDLRTCIEKAKMSRQMWEELPQDFKHQFNNSVEEFIDRGMEWAKNEIKKQQKPAEAPAEIPATAPAESKGE